MATCSCRKLWKALHSRDWLVKGSPENIAIAKLKTKTISAFVLSNDKTQ
ncbi:MAG: hypothetical protein HC903_30320 [Methylacidiphilales bacterium]|nr:hypothetical protein [Candidatus Methylacidiphilales bacterium]